jgi:hypothetical protein
MESATAASARVDLADDGVAGDAGGNHSRHRGLHESRAGARQGGRSARRHLGVRLRRCSRC